MRIFLWEGDGATRLQQVFPKRGLDNGNVPVELERGIILISEHRHRLLARGVRPGVHGVLRTPSASNSGTRTSRQTGYPICG